MDKASLLTHTPTSTTTTCVFVYLCVQSSREVPWIKTLSFKIEGERKEGGKKQREENKERKEEAEDTIDSSALDSAPAQTTSDICHDSLLKSQGKARFLILPTLLG